MTDIVTSKAAPVGGIGAARPAYAVFPPSLTRHVIYRIVEAQSPHLAPDKAAADARWAELLRAINAYIVAHGKAVGQPARSQFYINLDHEGRPPPPDIRLVKASETLLCTIREGRPGVSELKLRIDVHTDAFTITHIIDRIPDSWNISATLDGAAEDAVAAWYERVWDKPGGEHNWPLAPEEQIGHSKRLAEFRGLIVGVGDEPVAPPGEEPLFADAKRNFDTTTTAALDEKLSDFLDERKEFLHRFLRTGGKLEDRRSSKGAALSSTTEAVLCGMLGGEAIYASPILSDKSDVRYLVAFAGKTASQLGRFVRRLHTMGELRLYVLIDLNSGDGVDEALASEWSERDRPGGLRRAGQALRRLGAKVTRAFAEDKEIPIEEVAGISREYNAVSSLVGGGIIYRTERSQQFSRTFKDRLEDLRIVPLAGWQAYDAYVRRYQYHEHEFIAGIGRRFAQLGARIDRLMFLRQAQYNDKYQETSNNILKESQGTLKGIEKLQERAEDIGLLAGTYYGPQVLVHCLEGWREQLAGLLESNAFHFKVALKGSDALVSGAEHGSEIEANQLASRAIGAMGWASVALQTIAAVLIVMIVIDIIFFRRGGRIWLLGKIEKFRQPQPDSEAQKKGGSA